MFSISNTTFRIVYLKDFKCLSNQELSLLKKMPNHKNCRGVVVASSNKNKLISMVNFCEEIFPHEKSLSIHVFSKNQRHKYQNMLTIVTSMLLIIKTQKIDNLLVRLSKTQKPLLLNLLLRLDFDMIDYFEGQYEYVILKKKFEKYMLKGLESLNEQSLKSMYKTFIGKRNKSLMEYKHLNDCQSDICFSRSDFKLLARWLNFNKDFLPRIIIEWEKLIAHQEQIDYQRYFLNNNYFFLINNKKTKSCLIIFSAEILKSNNFRKLYAYFIKQKIALIYSNKKSAHLETILYIAGFRSYPQIGPLHIWKKI